MPAWQQAGPLARAAFSRHAGNGSTAMVVYSALAGGASGGTCRHARVVDGAPAPGLVGAMALTGLRTVTAAIGPRDDDAGTTLCSGLSPHTITAWPGWPA